MTGFGQCFGRYVGNTLYNVYNKKACAAIHAHWVPLSLMLCDSFWCFLMRDEWMDATSGT